MPIISDPTTNPLPVGQRSVVAEHALHQLFKSEWENLAHVREGTGGFMDGKYLVAHPREWKDHTSATPNDPTAKLTARRKLAHYENIAAAIIEAKKASLFRETATRRVGATSGDDPTEIEQWWNDVDGHGSRIDQLMPMWWDLAATFGHCALYMDVPPLPTSLDGEVLTAADQLLPTVRAYTPLDVLNWMTDDRGQIVAVKLAEAEPITDFLETSTTQPRFRIREVDTMGWRLLGDNGQLIDEGEHGLGRLPIAFLYGNRRAIISEIGQSVLGRSQQYIDLYNLVSELRELLRNQTFSFINLPLGTGDGAQSVDDATTMLGQQNGTLNVIFSALPAQILTGDSANVTSYQDEIKQRKRDIFRVTGVQWETDSRDSESAEALLLKREDQNTRLSAYADECQKAEMDLVDLWYRWRYGPDAGPDRIDDDQVIVQYPDRFDATPFESLVLQIQAAKDIGMPPVFTKQLQKGILAKFEGMADLDTETLNSITDAIDAAEDPPTASEMHAQMLELKTAAMAPGEDPDDDEEDEDADGEEGVVGGPRGRPADD